MTKKPYQIRIEEDLLQKVKEHAQLNERSVNAQIRFILKSFFKSIGK